MTEPNPEEPITQETDVPLGNGLWKRLGDMNQHDLRLAAAHAACEGARCLREAAKWEKLAERAANREDVDATS